MTCRDVMTSNPSCCVASDSVAMAAQIMKREDVGPVLVVSDYNSRTLIGIVTDRDLALKVVAEGRDPHNTRLDQVMTPKPVTCSADDSTSEAVRVMSHEQVRRLPIVDEEYRLIGIVSQADLARHHEDEEEVGEMVEEISQPYGTTATWFGEGDVQRASAKNVNETGDQRSLAASLGVAALCLGAGAGLMYLLDPSRGPARRARSRDRAMHLYSASGEAISSKATDLRNRATGVVASSKQWLQSGDEDVEDGKLEARVRSKMGRVLSPGHAISVSAQKGHLVLSGSCASSELSKLLKLVKGVPGVRSVENRIRTEEGFSTSETASEASEGATWSPTTRLMASAVGGGLLFYGLKSKSRVGKATATLGLGLLTRGVVNREVGGLNVSDLRKFVNL